ncbi:MAG: rhodanese-like domain-containing protein [Muribaculaceae bacterium]|nr:rhodanese-like domain-containing protein [Muribaculaceae bacterium]
MVSRGSGSGASTLTAYSNVNVDEFQSLIADPVMQLLDVRTQEEFDEGHIAGSVLVDVNDNAFVDKALSVLDTQRPVAVYCRSGRRSARAASLLTERGFKVTNLNGGVMAWKDAGKALIK